jgi:hypothetical protein
MKVAHDIFAETNPAFCTYALGELLKSYQSICKVGPELPIAYLGLPIALSGDFAATFAETNKNTGLLEWLERAPSVRVGIAERVNASLDLVTDAVRYGCFARVLALSPDGHFALGEKKMKAAPVARLDDLSSGVIKRASRLGYWFATAGTTRNIFSIMGLTV